MRAARARVAAVRALAVLAVSAAPALADAQIADMPAPWVDTGLELPDQIGGKLAWLDARTVAVTTYADRTYRFPWMIRRVVAYDVVASTARDLVSPGFLGCVNVDLGLVGFRRGDVRGTYEAGSKSPAPVPEFGVWNAQQRVLLPAPPSATTGWHPDACLKPDDADARSSDWLVPGRGSSRYLQPRHGTLRWDPLGGGAPQVVSLNDGRTVRPLDLRSDELAASPAYAPFADSYVVRAGWYAGPRVTPGPLPLVVLSASGKVTRTPLPESIRRLVDAKGGEATWLPVARGTLAYVHNRPEDGGGLYLAGPGGVKRLWCRPGDPVLAFDFRCKIESTIEVAPDGCRVAFVSSPSRIDPAALPLGLGGTVKVLDVCVGPKR